MERFRDTAIPTGKVQPRLLEAILGLVRRPDPDVVVGPSPGEDAAVLRLGERLVVVTSDPITFATPDPGRYAVHANANDVAVMGGVPRYLTVTLLLPPGTYEDQVGAIMARLVETADSLGVRVVGGHTEVTTAVTRPVVSLTLVGDLLTPEPLRTGGGRAGDAVIQVNPLAVEGTSILVAEHRERLVCDLGEPLVERAAALLEWPGISVVTPARLAVTMATVHAMHDPTEGGVATGLREIAAASGTGLLVREADLITTPETRAVCRVLGCDPLGLISSGCLLFTVAAEEAERVVLTMQRHGYAAACIGTLTPHDGQYWLEAADGTLRPLPSFAVDELASH